MHNVTRRRVSMLMLAPAVALMLLTATPALADEAEFSGFDANHDGKITMSEVMRHIRPAIRSGFDAMDRNHDGVLSRDDFNDVSEGMHKFQQWLDDLLKPFVSSTDREGKTQTF
ncbi:MAG: EF-hand domain-containing protein [Mariprofundaceae bacterium]